MTFCKENKQLKSEVKHNFSRQEKRMDRNKHYKKKI